MGNITSPWRYDAEAYRTLDPENPRPPKITGNDTPGPPSSEQVAAFDRTAWSRSIGISGRKPPACWL
jgi:hypothetical protein